MQTEPKELKAAQWKRATKFCLAAEINQLSTPFELNPYIIVNQKGHSVTLKKDSKKIMCNVSQVKQWIQPERETVMPFCMKRGWTTNLLTTCILMSC